MIAAIIPARGGSKGIRRKNLQTVGGGRTLIAHAVEHAQQARTVTEGAVYVSTEDAEIAEHARDLGVHVIQRPQSLATDEASTDDVLLHALEMPAVGHADRLVVLQPTSPLRTPADIDGCVQLAQSRYPAVISVTEHEGFAWLPANDRWLPVYYDPTQRPRRQDTRYVVENGAIYVTSPEHLTRYKSRCTPGLTGVYRMPRRRSLQIDTPEDLEFARDIYRLSQERT